MTAWFTELRVAKTKNSNEWFTENIPKQQINRSDYGKKHNTHFDYKRGNKTNHHTQEQHCLPHAIHVRQIPAPSPWQVSIWSHPCFFFFLFSAGTDGGDNGTGNSWRRSSDWIEWQMEKGHRSAIRRHAYAHVISFLHCFSHSPSFHHYSFSLNSSSRGFLLLLFFLPVWSTQTSVKCQLLIQTRLVSSMYLCHKTCSMFMNMLVKGFINICLTCIEVNFSFFLLVNFSFSCRILLCNALACAF